MGELLVSGRVGNLQKTPGLESDEWLVSLRWAR